MIIEGTILNPRTEVTQEVAEMIRTWSSRDAADFYDGKVREIEERERRTYAEFGLILLEVEKRELYREIPNPVCRTCNVETVWTFGTCDWCGGTQDYFVSFDRWLIIAAPVSRTTGYQAKRVVESMLAADVPIEKMGQIPRGNLEVVAKLSPSLRSNPAMLADAQVLSNDALLAKIEETHPEEHIESKRRLVFKPTVSAQKLIDDGLRVAAWLNGSEGREAALEFMAAALLTATCERDGFDGLSNLAAWEKSKEPKNRLFDIFGD